MPLDDNCLNFFRNSKLLEISGTALESLDLNSLEKIGVGDISIVGNRDLCYADSVNWTLLQTDSGSRVEVGNNRGKDACGQ
jgi:epidermal growth factor receptor